jgi:BirA family biotin operon repressor/biotin-[acetyl-CoA-carboxylase] ligase
MQATILSVSQITEADVQHLLRSTFVMQVEPHRELASTNDRALQLSHREENQYPLLVWAERQTEGRGRGPNRWWSGPGALTFSLLIDAERLQLARPRWPQISLAAALAVAEALQELLLDRVLQLKWPNDVYLERRKVCGILLESPADRPGVIVLGMGINVNNSLRDAPAELRQSAIALCDLMQRQYPLVSVLQSVLIRLAERLRWISTEQGQLPLHWQRWCLLTNRSVCVDMASRQVRGLCRGIDAEGALLLETEAGYERCFAGVVTQF